MTRRLDDLHVLVTGATGNQGGAVARELLDRDHRVRALTRSPTSAGARALEKLGAEVVEGDFEKPGTLPPAIEGVDAVFAVATPFEAGMEAETRQATNLVDAVADVGVDHLLYSSVASADEDTGIPHFESKVPVERRVRESPVASTIVGPVFFAENLVSPWFLPPIREEGQLALALPPDHPLQVISLPDVGAVMAEVLERRDEFEGERIEVASDEVTPTEMASAISNASGREIEPVEVPIDRLRAENEDFGLMFQWFQDEGYSVDLEAVRETFPKAPAASFETWARQVDWDDVLDG